MRGTAGSAPTDQRPVPTPRLDPVTFARTLRRRLTDEEQLLWNALRDRRFASFKFRRQVPIGLYIADFICFSTKLIIEIDGGYHNAARDQARDRDLSALGYRVLHITNRQLTSGMGSVLAEIQQALNSTLYPPSPTGAASPLEGTGAPSPLEGEGVAERRIRGTASSAPTDQRPVPTPHPPLTGHLLPQGEKEDLPHPVASRRPPSPSNGEGSVPPSPLEGTGAPSPLDGAGVPSPLEGEGVAERRMRGTAGSAPTDQRPVPTPHPPLTGHLLPQGEKEETPHPVASRRPPSPSRGEGSEPHSSLPDPHP